MNGASTSALSFKRRVGSGTLLVRKLADGNDDIINGKYKRNTE